MRNAHWAVLIRHNNVTDASPVRPTANERLPIREVHRLAAYSWTILLCAETVSTQAMCGCRGPVGGEKARYQSETHSPYLGVELCETPTACSVLLMESPTQNETTA